MQNTCVQIVEVSVTYTHALNQERVVNSTQLLQSARMYSARMYFFNFEFAGFDGSILMRLPRG
jgi:hypothetical protein